MRIAVIGDGPWAQVYRSLLPEPEAHPFDGLPDAAIIVNKAHMHWQTTLQYLRWGVPCLVEKPFAMSVPQCEEMIETAEKFGTYLAAAHVLKFDRRIEAMRQHLTRVNQIVRITWTDPANGRYDERVTIESDVIPHIVSIIDTLAPGAPITCEGVRYGGRGREYRLSAGGFTFDIHLERDADARRRLIQTDGCGYFDATLDFSALPADHNPLRELIREFAYQCGDPIPEDPATYRFHPLHTNLALRACRVTEDVLAKAELWRRCERMDTYV